MNEKFWVDLVGWAGSALVVGAYAFNIAGRLKASSRTYLLSNIVGSIGLVINTIYIGAYPSACVNVIWIFIALWGIFQKSSSSDKVLNTN